MGSSGSKVARKLPRRQKIPDINKVYDPVKDLGQYKVGDAASNRPAPQISEARDTRIETDGKDPQLLDMLRRAGPVKYNDSQGPNVTTGMHDPLRSMYENRKRLVQEVATEEDSATPRRFIEISEIVAILDARKQGISDEDIVQRFNTDKEVLTRLGRMVNTPTQTGEKDDNGNSKAVWADKI